MSQTTLFDIAGFDSSVQGSGWIVGVDEVGRGPLIGEVVAAAVILPESCSLRLNDSKKLSESRREVLSEQIKLNAHAYAIASASPAEIDELNILNATMLAMQRAVKAVSFQVETIERVLVDGNRCPKISFPCQAIVKGDGLVAEISAASILAKVERDAQMRELDQVHPQYGFAQHKGYPTASHLQAIEKHGLLPGYRRSFKPVKRLLETDESV